MVRASGSRHSRGARDDPDDRQGTWGSRGGSSALSVISVPLATLPASVGGPDSSTHQDSNPGGRYHTSRSAPAPRGSQLRSSLCAGSPTAPSSENGFPDGPRGVDATSPRAVCPPGGAGRGEGGHAGSPARGTEPEGGASNRGPSVRGPSVRGSPGGNTGPSMNCPMILNGHSQPGIVQNCIFPRGIF